ncbi:MAG TPA: GxxExxY protein [Holophagaceae bacterium]|nr:GxxExxY protein [Holophagaceae bacterium]
MVHRGGAEDAGVDFNDLTERVLGLCIEVHRQLGPGLLESAYQTCLAFELEESGLPFEREVHLPVTYKSRALDANYRLDFVVAGKVVLELKSVESLQAIHEAQVLTYLRLSGHSLGLLINFNAPLLKQGIKRVVLNHPD